MATFEEILNMAREGAEKVGQKTSDFVEVTRMKMRIAEIEKEVAATYEGLGRLVYDAEKSGQDSDDEDGEDGMVGGMLGSFLGKLKDTQIINAAEYKM